MTSDQATAIVLALVAGLPTTLAVILASMIQLRRQKASDVKIAAKVEDVAILAAASTKDTVEAIGRVDLSGLSTLTGKIDGIADQTAQVHLMVNSRLSEALAEIERLRLVVEGQRDTIRGSGGKPDPMGPSKIGERKEEKK